MAEQATQPQTTFCWHECVTPDPAAAKKFFTELFGWTSSEMPMGDQGTYSMLHAGEEPVAGVMGMEGPEWEGIPPHWMSYIQVDDLDASCGKVTKLGGSIKVPPTEIPNNMGKFAVIADPSGAVISLYEQPSGSC